MFDGIKNLLSALVIAAPVTHFGIMHFVSHY
jgi:hypothetical protein